MPTQKERGNVEPKPGGEGSSSGGLERAAVEAQPGLKVRENMNPRSSGVRAGG